MPTCCTVPARYRRIRSNSRSNPGRFAGRPDSSDHTSGLEPTALPKPSQLPKSSKPECASDSLFAAVPQHGTQITTGPTTITRHRFRSGFRGRGTDLRRCVALRRLVLGTRNALLLGAGGGTRTHTTLPSRDFKSLASTSSATSAFLFHNAFSVSGNDCFQTRLPKNPLRVFLSFAPISQCRVGATRG
jgi:hypothetical protein